MIVSSIENILLHVVKINPETREPISNRTTAMKRRVYSDGDSQWIEVMGIRCPCIAGIGILAYEEENKVVSINEL